MAELTAPDIHNWLAEKLAHRLNVPTSEVDGDKFFDEFGLESTEALVLAGELEKWLGMELETTALWYHPTINQLSEFIASEIKSSDAQ